ncbi:MAG: Glycosyltransferase involved in cell wall biogenesis [Candidatus Adlerbacteria bacterium GW2011_GWA1_54_10]|uniref:Glycosyltransferase involved in cell wall biogenesis n=3 Tax=Candidatus Adleribacteriota TaxID=1752736 RepID=A0A0G1XWQ1_9BACT|nr:MAG: Glycosyltransferase involved in cell wall biogenesis [Candidatus Adlerbacteria bacterium GW2011_GWA1_54_10]KKW38051.1 MAG: Glycosyltransferase involved in cell wall biogenesis [Candidatus Adlerbacteria bacterium GW2011_GWB1_54_7]
MIHGMNIGELGVYASLFLALYFEIFLLISFFERRPAPRTARQPARYPNVAILVPSYNEERTIAGTLESLLSLDYPKDKLELVVVDDGSMDKTGNIAKKFATEHPQVKYFYKENGGKYTALNWGLERTSAEFVGCLDADSFVAPDALLETIKRFEESPDTMAVVPAMKVYRPRRILELMQSVEYTFGIFYKKMFDNLAAISVLPGPFSLYRREVFEKIGMFRHAHNTEDMEIAFRMHANGLKIVNAHTAHVYTTVPKTVRALIRQRTRWSQGFLQNSRDYAYMYFNRRYGNFGLLVLPFGLAAFAAGLYTATYMLYNALEYAVSHALDYWSTGVPLQAPAIERMSWFYLNTNTMIFVVVAVLGMTFVAIILGARLANVRLPLKSYAAYFALFGLIAPLWLAKAAWGALLARESIWR